MSYAPEYPAYDPFAIDAALDERTAFIRRTYLHVFGAILAFVGLEAIFLSTPAIHEPLLNLIGHNWWIALIGFMAVSWIAEKWAHSGTSAGVQYADWRSIRWLRRSSSCRCCGSRRTSAAPI